MRTVTRLLAAVLLAGGLLVVPNADAAVKAPPRLPNVGPCQITIVRYIPSLHGYYRICG